MLFKLSTIFKQYEVLIVLNVHSQMLPQGGTARTKLTMERSHTNNFVFLHHDMGGGGGHFFLLEDEFLLKCIFYLESCCLKALQTNILNV